MGIKLPKQVNARLEDGVHTGEIVEVLERTQPFAYVDFVIKVDDTDNLKLKFGCPASIVCDKDGTPTSKLAKVCNVLGILEEETTIENAIGKKIKFQTISEKTDAGVFSRIIVESVKLN